MTNNNPTVVELLEEQQYKNILQQYKFNIIFGDKLKDTEGTEGYEEFIYQFGSTKVLDLVKSNRYKIISALQQAYVQIYSKNIVPTFIERLQARKDLPPAPILSRLSFIENCSRFYKSTFSTILNTESLNTILQYIAEADPDPKFEELDNKILEWQKKKIDCFKSLPAEDNQYVYDTMDEWYDHLLMFYSELYALVFVELLFNVRI